MGGPVCCGLIPHLELAIHPELYGRPVVIGDWQGGVVAVSPEASSFGVRPGIALRQAEHLCPQAVIVPPEPAVSRRLLDMIAAALYDIAPAIEVRMDGTAWLDLEGIIQRRDTVREARYRLREAAHAEPRLGLAPGPFTARLAAAQARPGRLVRVDNARSFLAPFSVSELDLEPQSLERLRLLGLRTLRDVAAIGPRQLESQVGKPGRLAVLTARGEEPTPLTRWQPPSCTNVRRQFEPPLEDREALLFVGRVLCEDLAKELGLRGAGAKRITVKVSTETGACEEKTSLVRHPLSGPAELFGLVGGWLKEWQPAAPVVELAVEIPEIERAGRRQLRLWVGGDGSKEEVTAALDRLQERFGEAVVAKPRPHLVASPVPAQRFEWVTP